MISSASLEDYNVSPINGFLPTEPPLECLPDEYYEPWEFIVRNLQGLIISNRLRPLVDTLPVLSTDRLHSEPEWRRAYCALAFIVHAYIWGEKRPAERVPPPLSIPFLAVCEHLELPPVATFAGVCLWNWKPIFSDESTDTLSNLDTIDTFTGSIDEKWFYLISVAIEAKGGPLVPLLLDATQAADRGDRQTVVDALRTFAETLDDIGTTLTRMYDHCDPHIFYHRIRPFLAGTKNMADAGLPNGVIFDNGGPMHKQRYVQFAGGSNAQSSLIQFFDLILSIEHRPTADNTTKNSTSTQTSQQTQKKPKKPSQPSGFHQEMRKYMPAPHSRFLSRVAESANLRSYVHDSHPNDTELSVAFDACVAMLTALRDKHIQIVSRYIVIKSREAAAAAAKKDENGAAAGLKKSRTEVNLAAVPRRPAGEQKDLQVVRSRGDGGQGDDGDMMRKKALQGAAAAAADAKTGRAEGKGQGGESCLKGTGGSSLIPFLRQARDETTEPAISEWAQRVLAQRGRKPKGQPPQLKHQPLASKDDQAEIWRVENGVGGLCIQ